MEVQLFLEYLPWLRSPQLKVKLEGVDVDYIKIEARRTTPVLRATSLELSSAPIEIQSLFTNYDLSNIHLIWTSFWAEPQRLKEGWGFAAMSEANIVLTPSGRIEAFNAHPIRAIHGDSQFLGALAWDMESYLEALLCCQMMTTHFVSGFADEGPVIKAKLESLAKLCSTIAGGDEYYGFWAEVLGLPSPSES